LTAFSAPQQKVPPCLPRPSPKKKSSTGWRCA
jgi:hypothetical protein